MAEFAPGMRVLIRDEEWMIRKCDPNSYNTYTLQCVGVSPLVRDKTAYFLSDLEKITVIDPAKTTLVPDNSARFTRSRLFLESLWRQKIPTDAKLHIGHHAVMDVIPSFEKGEVIFCMAGSIPNRRSAPLVDEWFGLRFVNGRFDRRLSMDELLSRTQFDRSDRPNAGTLTEEDAQTVSALRSDAVAQAKRVMAEAAQAYTEGPYAKIYPELEKLERLRERHEAHLEEKYEQLTFFGKQKQKEAEQRHIEKIFDEFYDWVKDGMDIEAEHPYIRVVAAFTGVNA